MKSVSMPAYALLLRKDAGGMDAHCRVMPALYAVVRHGCAAKALLVAGDALRRQHGAPVTDGARWPGNTIPTKRCIASNHARPHLLQRIVAETVGIIQMTATHLSVP